VSAKLPKLTAAQRSMRAKIASYDRWADEADRVAAMKRATENSPASIGYWEKRVDPDNTLSPQSRRDMAKAAQSAHFARLAYNSSRSRQVRRAGGDA
jgi:hypothetical protein